MKLGLKGKKAVICASSRGLGFGCALALAQEGCDVIMNGRNPDTLAAAAEKIRQETGVKVEEVAADVTTPEGQEALIAVAKSADILITNAGGPPPGLWSDWDREDYIKALDANMLAPIALITALLPSMIEKKWGRIVNITSGSVKSPIPQLGLSNAARTGLTGFVAGTARQVAQHGVVMNNLLPGIHDTDRATSLDTGVAEAQNISLEQARKAREATLPVGRYGTVEEFGATCAFMCSQYAGYMIGQNILLDGGAFASTL